MKKVVLVLVVVVVSSTNNAFQGSQLIQKDAPCGYNQRFLDAESPRDEYVHVEENQSDIDEYDQNVCDNVQPPKISVLEASLRDIMGKILVHCLIVKEMATVCLKEVTDTLNKWFTVVLKA